MTTTCGLPECAVRCIMVVITGVSGDRMLFMHPFRKPIVEQTECNADVPSSSSYYHPHPKAKDKPTLTKLTDAITNTEEVMTEFTLSVELLAQILTVPASATNQGFDLKIDNQRFVAWPKNWRQKGCKTDSRVSIVFALKASADAQTVQSYQKLSNKLAVSFVTLQQVDQFLEQQEKIANDEDCFATEPFKLFRQKSRMAQVLVDVYNDLTTKGNVHKYVMDFVEVGFCDEAHSLSCNNVIPKGKMEIEKIIRKMKPYHGILILEDVWPTPDANPVVANLLRHCSPDRSILDMSTSSGIPIFEVFLIIRHLITWARAVLIYPLCNTNVYTSATSPQSLEKMAEKFAQQFGATIHLAAGLAHFNPPATLESFIRPNLSLAEQVIRSRLVVSLIRHQMLMQLHQFFYILKPYSSAVCPPKNNNCPNDMKRKIAQSNIPEDVKELVGDICGEMLRTMSFAEVDEKLTHFIQIAPLMDGEHHLEDIKYTVNLDRQQIEDVLESFQLVIAKFLRPDFVAE